MAVLFQCLLCVKLYECHIKYAGRFLDIKEISNIPDCHDIGLATTEICQYLICLQLCSVHITVPEYQALWVTDFATQSDERGSHSKTAQGIIVLTWIQYELRARIYWLWLPWQPVVNLVTRYLAFPCGSKEPPHQI